MIHTYSKLNQTTVGVDGEDWITLPPVKVLHSTGDLVQIKVYNRESLIHYLRARFNFISKDKVKDALAAISTKIR